METPVTRHGEVVDKPEFDFITSLAQELAAWFVDFYAGQNVVQPGGGALGAQAGTPIVVTYAGFTALVNGPARMARYVVSSGTVTLAAADATNPRYDLIVGTASQTTGTDTGGQPTNKDVLTVTKVTGTPASTPAIPSLPVNSVQLGYVLVPANATSAQTCTITPSLAPLAPKNLQDLTNHIAASVLTTAVHGAQATLPGGSGANQLAQTDASGNVGAANYLATGTTRYPPTLPGGSSSNSAAITDANGNVGSAGYIATGTSRYPPTTPGGVSSNSAAITDASGRVGYAVKADNLANAGVTIYPDKGVTAAQTVPNAGYYIFTITFNKPFTAAPALNVTVQSPGGVALPVQYGMQVVILSVTATTATVQVGQTTGFAQSLQLNWNALGS